MANGYQDFDNGSDWFDDNHPDNNMSYLPGEDPTSRTGTSGGGGSLPPGVSQAQADAFLAANPNDAHRLAEAFADDNSGGGGGRVSLSGFGGSGGPSPYRAFTEQFVAPTRPGDIDDKWTKEFAWDPSTNVNDPALKFRMEQAQKMRERSASAKGNLLTGGTAAQLDEDLVGVAAQYENDDFNRAMSKYSKDFETFTGDRSRRAGQYNQDFSNSRGAYLDKANIWNTNEMGRFNTERTNRMDDQSILNDNRNFGLAESGQKFGQDLSLAQFGRQLDRDQMGDLFSLANYGYGAAGGAANAGQQYGDSAGEDITGAGNAGAAGVVGSANAFNGALNNIGNFAQTAALYRQSTLGGR